MGKIVGPKNEVVYCEAGGNNKQMSVLVTIRADGRLMTSAIVYPYKKEYRRLLLIIYLTEASVLLNLIPDG